MGALVLQAAEVDSDLELAPFPRQAKALRFEARVNIGELDPKTTQHARRFLEKVMTNDAAAACELQLMAKPFPHALAG
jgi:hypothetical protein